MGLASLMILTAIASSNGQTKESCANKTTGDTCGYQSNKGTCCKMLTNAAGNPDKFCRGCDVPGAMMSSTCTIHSRQGYLGCFSKKEDAAVFQVCIGQSAGSDCMYESAASRGKKAYNTTGYCIAHYSHQQIMCLEAVGDADDEECEGKGVGQPCNHSTSAAAVCAHHSRRGNWMCLAPKEESMVFVICQGASAGTACSYTSNGTHGTASGLIQGQCHPHSAGSILAGGHGGMMCVDPAHYPTLAPGSSPAASSAPDGISTRAIALIAVAVAIVSCF